MKLKVSIKISNMPVCQNEDNVTLAEEWGFTEVLH